VTELNFGPPVTACPSPNWGVWSAADAALPTGPYQVPNIFLKKNYMYKFLQKC